MYSAPSDDVTTAAEVLARAKQVALWRSTMRQVRKSDPRPVCELNTDTSAITHPEPVAAEPTPEPAAVVTTEQLVEEVPVAPLPRRRPTSRLIISMVGSHFDIKPHEFRGRSRRQVINKPRQIVMYLLRHVSKHSYPEIGRILGGRDHTTIIHGCMAVQERMDADDDFLTLIIALHHEIERRAAQ